VAYFLLYSVLDLLVANVIHVYLYLITISSALVLVLVYDVDIIVTVMQLPNGSPLLIYRVNILGNLLAKSNMINANGIFSSLMISGRKLKQYVDYVSDLTFIVGALQHVTVTKPEISYSCVNLRPILLNHTRKQLKGSLTILKVPSSMAYISVPVAILMITGTPLVCAFALANLVSWGSFTKVEYCNFASDTPKILWFKHYFVSFKLLLPHHFCSMISIVTLSDKPCASSSHKARGARTFHCLWESFKQIPSIRCYDRALVSYAIFGIKSQSQRLRIAIKQACLVLPKL
ncbi:hypothetical protein CR513_61570, partial [Mucuna pruriens]